MRWVLLALVALAAAGCESHGDRFPLGLDRMRDQPRYDPYQRSDFFADGKTMRPLPAGAVAQESGDEPDAAAVGQVDGVPVREVPIAITRTLLDRGRNRYDVFCRPCHDTNGSAESPVAKNMQLRQPPSLLEVRIRDLPVGRIYQAVAEGYGLMPSYARQLSVDERWAVVAYVRALQLRDRVAVDSLPAPVRAAAEQALRGPR